MNQWICRSFLAVLTAAAMCAAQDQAPTNVLVGILVSIPDNSVSVKSNNGNVTVAVDSSTKIWRGGPVNLHNLRLGDDLIVRYHLQKQTGEMVAFEIDANLENWSGTISKVAPHSVTILREDEHGDPLGPATILIDNHTDFSLAVPIEPKEAVASMRDLKAGGSLQTIGLDLRNGRMRATKVLTILPPPSNTR